MSAESKYLRAREIVALTGMSLRTVRRWLADEVLPSTKVRGARIVATADLTAVLSGPQDTIQEPSDEQEEYDKESKE
jgi:hypothetical protein